MEEGSPGPSPCKRRKTADVEVDGGDETQELVVIEPVSSTVIETEVNLKESRKNEDCSSTTCSAENGVRQGVKISERPVETSEIKSKTYMKERDMGILEYISKHEGFFAVLKQRYADFLVRERTLSGELVRLTNVSAPEQAKAENQAVGSSTTASFLSEYEREQIQKLCRSVGENDSVTLSYEDDKERRTQMHKYVRENYPSLDSDTVEVEDGHKAVRVFKSKKNGNSRKRPPPWPANRGNYCKFVLYKENKDTMDAVNLISKLSKLKPTLFSYAGTKDRRAITVQEMTAYQVEAKKLHGLNKILRNMRLGNFEYVKERLRLGDLSGNHFSIVLREVTGAKEQVETALTSLENNGFINYFGLQRFGTTSIPTYEIGKAILHSNWQKAVDLILAPRTGEPADITKARQHWVETKDPKSTLELMPRQKSIEVCLMQGLIKHGVKNLVTALQMIPRNTRLMYIHAYQSYVWNFMVSKRIEEFGLRPLEGDLVYSSEHKDAAGETSAENSVHQSVRVLTKADVNSGAFTIHDVVMPLPGYDVIYPGHDASIWYRTMLEEDGLDIDQLRHKVKDYSLSGTYRKMVVKPLHMAWSLSQYDDVAIPLFLSDLDILQNKSEPEEVANGKLCAIKMEFTLPLSTYATMAVREVLKMDTSSGFQSTLNSTN